MPDDKDLDFMIQALEAGKRKIQENGGCFAATTMIMTPNGPEQISRVRDGQRVLSWNQKEQTISSARIKRVSMYENVRIFNIQTTEHIISSTKYHPFLTTQGWKKVHELEPGMRLRRNIGSSAIKNIRKTENIERVYNLTVEPYQTFFADGYIAHSFCHFRALRQLPISAMETISSLTAIPEVKTAFLGRQIAP